jgi:beta-glucosidase
VKEVLASRTSRWLVGVDVKNTGSVAGTEVVQLYIRNTAASVEQPVRELKGLCARHAGARRAEACGVSAGVRRVEFL